MIAKSNENYTILPSHVFPSNADNSTISNDSNWIGKDASSTGDKMSTQAIGQAANCHSMKDNQQKVSKKNDWIAIISFPLPTNSFLYNCNRVTPLLVRRICGAYSRKHCRPRRRLGKRKDKTF